MNISHYILHIHINIHKHTDRPTKLYTGDLYITKNSNICKIKYKKMKKQRTKCSVPELVTLAVAFCMHYSPPTLSLTLVVLEV